MSDHEYTPKSKFGKWFNDRLPILTLAIHLTEYPTPKNLNYWCTSGRIRKGPAPTNMEVPKYEFVNSNTIKIG